MFEGFVQRRLATSTTYLNARIGGAGPPLVLLHGYPQTHVMWHAVAPVLARDFTVVCLDLRGYGDSGRPPSDPEHLAYSKRTMALDVVEAMEGLGFGRFSIAGHDRGGRVTHRLCLDHPDRVERAAVLDIVPTRTLYAATDKSLGDQLLSLVLPDPAVAAARAAHRGRPDLLFAQPARRLVGRQGGLREPGSVG